MAKVFIVANHSPEQTLMWMMQEGLISKRDYYVNPFHKRIDKTTFKQLKTNILFLSFKDLLNNFSIVNNSSLSDRNVFVFAPDFRTTEIEGCHYLDFDHDPSDTTYSVKSLDLDVFNQAQSEDLVRTRIDFQKTVLHKIKSILTITTPLMTIIYGLKAPIQKQYTFVVCSWIYKGGSVEELEDLLDSLKVSEFSITKNKRQAFLDLLSSPVADAFKEAFVDVRTQDKPNINAIAKKHSLQAYDLRYISKVIELDESLPIPDVTIKKLRSRTGAKRKRTSKH